MTFIIVDLEATCCNGGSIPRNEMEIIEIGAVALENRTYNIISEFDTLVKPVRNPKLTQFCTKLTSISQTMVDNCETFSQALDKFKDWLSNFDKPEFCSWGNYDKNQLIRDCQYHKLDYPFNSYHINIKKRFAQKNGLAKPVSLGKAIRMVNLEFVGTPHRGIEDAKNMARLSDYIFGKKRLHS